jgi:hypothetical protein
MGLNSLDIINPTAKQCFRQLCFLNLHNFCNFMS